MTNLNTIKKNTKQLTHDVANRLNTSHDNVIDVLTDVHMLVINNGLDVRTGIITHKGKSMMDDCTITTIVETTNEKIATITTEAVENGNRVAIRKLVNTAHDDKETIWETAE